MNINQDENNYFKELEEINYGRYFRLVLLQSKMIFAITLASLVLGIGIYLGSTKTYKISSWLQVYSPNQSFDPRQSLNVDFFAAPETNLDNLLTLYSSRSNLLNLINELNLNIKFDNPDDKEFLDIKTFLFEIDKDYLQKIFYIQIQNNSFNLLDDQKNIIIKGINGEYVENNQFQIQLNFPDSSSEKLIEITYRNPSNLYNLYKNKIKIDNLGNSQNYWGSKDGLIEISLITDDIFEGKKIINLANEIFIKDNIKVETEKAKASMAFIDSQLEGLEEVLNLRKSELKNFKQENKSLNVNLEVESIIGLVSDIEREINLVDLEISQAEMNFTKDNPLYLNLKSQREALKLQKNSIERKIKNLPIAQQEYVDLFRNLEVSDQLYSELVTRRLNFSLMEASSIGNIRVVDHAYVKNLVGPTLSNAFLLTITAFFISLLIAIFRGIFFIKISNPAELKDAGISDKILGVIPHFEGNEDPFNDDKFQQSIETSILNIETIFSSFKDTGQIDGCRKIVITGPTPNNGKSFVSRNIAIKLSLIGHKVLLLDSDLKRGVQHKFFNKESIDIKTFENISLDAIENLKIKENLYLLPRLKKLKNTFEHLYSDQFLNKIKELENFFDYIVIDTSPALNVSDTGLLMTSSDINILIVRHQVNKISEINQTKQIIDQIGRAFDGIIYNDYSRPKGYYGYYDLYGDYSYRYYAERYLYDDYYDEKDD